MRTIIVISLTALLIGGLIDLLIPKQEGFLKVCIYDESIPGTYIVYEGLLCQASN